MNKYEMIKLTLSSSIMGGIVVSISNYFFNKRLKIREARLKQLDRILEKQFNAYENILNYFEMFKTLIEVPQDEVQNLKEYDNGKLLTFPYCFKDEAKYSEVMFEFKKLREKNEKWVHAKLKERLFEFEMYTFNLTKTIENINSKDYWKVGVIVYKDISYYANEIIDVCYEFYNRDIFNTKIRFENKGIKYNQNDIMENIKNTRFYKNRHRLKKIEAYKKRS